jgi:hypothetical protein
MNRAVAAQARARGGLMPSQPILPLPAPFPQVCKIVCPMLPPPFNAICAAICG